MDEQFNQTQTPASTPSAVEARKSPVGRILLVVLVILLIGGAAAVGYNLSNNKAKKETATLNSQLAVLKSNSHELPAGAVKVSDCIPNMGAHYLPKASDPEYGPFVLVNKAGKVIGLEYMASKDMYTAIPNTNPPVELIMKDSPLSGWKFDHIEFSHLPKGHEGLLIDHIDVHLFTVTPKQQKQSCI